MDANWRVMHNKSGTGGCIVAKGLWDEKLCPNPRTCAKNCAIDGLSKADYANNYGIIGVDDGVRLSYVTKTPWGQNTGSRLYVIDGDDYKIFRLKNREVAFTVDLTTLPCGLNAALYFVEMERSGGRGPTNKAGAKYGLGYCDARCPHSSNFIGGLANMQWSFGDCCAEMDLWEANRMATSFTAHPCDFSGQKKCIGIDCGDTNKGQHYEGRCDKDGCQFNPYRLGDRDFYGMEKIVDSTLPITVVTQFLTEDGTDDGDLNEIRRFYMQGGFVIPNTAASVGGMSGNSVKDGFCKKQKVAFNETRAPNNEEGSFDQFSKKGGLKSIGDALGRGMVLAFSIWDDPETNMHWLDSTSPRDLDESVPGVKRGPCKRRDGKADALRSSNGDGFVEFSRIRYGSIGSTLAQISAGTVRKFAKRSGKELDATDTNENQLAFLTSMPVAGFLAVAVAAALVAAASWRRRTVRGFGILPPYSSLLDAPPPAGEGT